MNLPKHSNGELTRQPLLTCGPVVFITDRYLMENSVRIIGGKWKRTRLTISANCNVRPTPNRVRETLFNWLEHGTDQPSLQGLTALDCFAGSGALGFEAASRGAAKVVMIEQHPLIVRSLQTMQQKLNASAVQIIAGNALNHIKLLVDNQQTFDIIFLDPPYRSTYLLQLWPWLTQLLKPYGRIYVEAQQALAQVFTATPEQLAPFDVLRANKAGQVFYHLLRCKK